MAQRSPIYRTWTQASPARGRRPRFRAVRSVFALLTVLTLIGMVAYGYGMQVYAPGLRAEAQTVPQRVRDQLAQERAPYIPLSQISPHLQEAIVAIEDRRFYHHPGIDPLSMIRASWVDLTAHHLDQGGSTLEQQLVKRTIVYEDGNLHDKLRTLALAWAVDQVFSKRKVLELYLNAAYYGQGAYGAAEAAHVYFGTDAAHLTVAQAAFLAALPQAPSVYGAQPRSAMIRDRRMTVLQDMYELGYITNQQKRVAMSTPLVFALPNP